MTDQMENDEKQKRIAGGIATAIRHIIHEGASLPRAAEEGGVKLETLLDAIMRPHVQDFMDQQNMIAQQIDHIVDVSKTRAIKRAAMEILSSNAPANQKIKAMELLNRTGEPDAAPTVPDDPRQTAPIIEPPYTYSKPTDTPSVAPSHQDTDTQQ